MDSTRYKVAGGVSLVGGGLAIVLQYLVTPLKDGNTDAAGMLATVAAHRTAMGWAVALDFAVLLALPAMLFLGALARMGTSKLAAAGVVLLFFPLLISLPPVFGFDALAYFASSGADPAAMASLVDAWQSSAYFAVGLIPYIVCQLVGSVMLAVALARAGSVPRWVAIGIAVWPFLSTAGIAFNLPVLAVVGYVVLLATWTVSAVSLVRPGVGVAARPAAVAS